MKPTWESECGTVKLWNGDCVDVLKAWPRVDALITDPPYGIDYQSAWKGDRTRWKPKIANDLEPAIEWLEFVAFESCLCFCRWDVQEAFRAALAERSVVRAQVIWDRVVHGMGDLFKGVAPQHDIIWFACEKCYKFPGKRPKSVVQHMRLSGDVLVHPNEKPVELMIELVRDYALPEWVVADPFMGSGTTGVAAVRLGRSFWGVELDSGYFEIAKSRIQDELARAAFLEGGHGRAKQRTMFS